MSAPPKGARVGASRLVCADTGFALVGASTQEFGWRIARERYVASGGITAVRKNSHVGPLPDNMLDSRGRFDTIGRTVYFGATERVCCAEVLQDFRKNRLALKADAKAAGVRLDDYIELVAEQAAHNGVDPPWKVGADWQMERCLHKVQMPTQGWWIDISRSATLDAVGLALADKLKALGIEMMTLGTVHLDDRGVTTLIAQHIRMATLFDGSLPLGIQFDSKTGNGKCYAWWNRRLDDGLMPSANDPRTVEDFTTARPAMRTLCAEWGLEF